VSRLENNPSAIATARPASLPARPHSDQNACDDAAKNDTAPQQRTSTGAEPGLGRWAERLIAMMWEKYRHDERGQDDHAREPIQEAHRPGQ
jgi:hypothetical protein